MTFIKQNKLVILVISIFIIITLALVEAYKVFQGDNGVVYGNRLEGIEKVEIKDAQKQKMIAELEGNENITAVKVSIMGKTINIIITVIDGATIDIAKGLGNSTLQYFEKVQLTYYDFQVFIKKIDKIQNNFPIIGYKHSQSETYIWTKDREVTQ